MNDTAQIILAASTLITAIGTLILGLVNRNTINTVKTQTDGMVTSLQAAAHRLGAAEGKADEIQYQRDNPPVVNATLTAEDPVKVEIVKIPTIKP